MFRQGYRVVVCEGADQVGKADVILNLSRKLLSQGIPVTYSSFPIYATPWGSMIRHSLMHGLTKFFPTTTVEELRVRYSFLAINRLEFMEVLLSKPVSLLVQSLNYRRRQ